MGYNSTPQLDLSKLAAHAGAAQTGALAGSFSAADPLTGVATAASFSYTEAGYFNFAVNGVETYHARGSTTGKELAEYVHSQIIADTGAGDRSVRAAGFYVIAKTSMPAILVETGFVTNPTEAANLDNPSYQKRMAEAIAKGIDQFMRVRGK